ncbi:unnamed protein product [Callosobruchus maculatus]|uniref:Sulfatase N-terminal domain-containing protein n=1 Tax=Callosobruchus maculatus TaxID=64391 RepID=A0A653CJ73_CALMS|nr:unnamed protein product [Callosobruchus maculatus]
MMWCTLLAIIFTVLEVKCAKENVTNRKLNVLLMLADDAGFEINAYGNKICQTPNLNRLSKDSLIFNYAFTSVSSCSPSRAALLTGKPSHQNGMFGLHQAENHFNSFDKIKSLPKILKQHGIKTGIIGKKHVGPESVFPFDFAETEENHSILQVGRNITLMKLLTRRFLNETGDSPFFLYIGFHDPHRCGHTQPQFGQFCEHFGNGDTGMGLIPDWHPIYYQPEQVQLPYYLPNTWETRVDVAAQYTTMSRLDQGVGLILKELQDSGHLNDTLIIFTSDNGIPFPNGRTNLYDSGIQEPLFISSPLHKERKGQVTSSLASHLDIMPTILDWYGIDKKQMVEDNEINGHDLLGRSLLDLLIEEPKDKSKEAVYASHNLHEVTMYYPMRMVRTHQYKLIHNINYYSPFPIDQDFYISPTFQDLLNRTKTHQNLYWFKTLEQYYKRPEWELFDLKHDPEELNNIVKKNTSQEIFKILKNELMNWQKATSDPWLCAPHAVLEDKGAYKNNLQCMDLDNQI